MLDLLLQRRFLDISPRGRWESYSPEQDNEHVGSLGKSLHGVQECIRPSEITNLHASKWFLLFIFQKKVERVVYSDEGK